jgi:hypothetical protein
MVVVAKEKCFIALLTDSEKTDTLSWKIQRVSVLFLLRFQIIKLKSTSRCVFSCFWRCLCRCFTKQYVSFRSQSNFYGVSSEIKPSDNQHWTIATVESPSNLVWKSFRSLPSVHGIKEQLVIIYKQLYCAVFSWLNVPCTRFSWLIDNGPLSSQRMLDDEGLVRAERGVGRMQTNRYGLLAGKIVLTKKSNGPN